MPICARAFAPPLFLTRRALLASRPTTARLAARNKCITPLYACVHSAAERDDLQDLYTITKDPDLPLARRTAVGSTRSLSTFLQKCPISPHTRDAFDEFLKWRRRPNAPSSVCIDACCGNGWSTVRIARQFPDCDVVGIDKSFARLHRNAAFRHGGLFRDLDNAFLLRADMVHFWRLCWDHKIFPKHQYILYPNPYPKPGHLKRRWHGHPIFPIIVAMGGRMEVRASWEGYLEEFSTAYKSVYNSLHRRTEAQIHHKPTFGPIEKIVDLKEHDDSDDHPLSNFEAKYLRIGLPVYRLVIENIPKSTNLSQS